jgi:hypothetical protein
VEGQRQHWQRGELGGESDGQQLGGDIAEQQAAQRDGEAALDRRHEQRQAERRQRRQLEAGIVEQRRLDRGHDKDGQCECLKQQNCSRRNRSRSTRC